jgi:glycosyltransferase involved in cell wall biosynthesis
VVVGYETGRSEVQRLYGVPDERIRFLPHPTPDFALNPPALDADSVLEKYGLEAGFIFYPAQFWPHKNHVAILHALRLLRDANGVTTSAVFVGADKGNKGHVMATASKLGLENHVHFLGFVSRPELVALYQLAGAVVYPSFFGPENLPPLEAFALRCPVVAADVPGAREQLGDAAILIDPRSEEAIAEAVLRLLHDAGERSELVERGRNRAESFTAADYVNGMVAIMDELVPVVRTWRS